MRVWLAGICAGTMRWLEILSVSLFTLETTGSAFMVALMYFARTGPTLLCGPIAGVVADRLPRKPLYAGGLALLCAASGTLAYLAFSGTLQLWQVAVGAVVSGVVWSLEHTTRRTIARDVVHPESVGNAISLDTGSQNATRMLGPLLGGSLMALIGIKGAYLSSAILFGVGSVLVLSVARALPAAGAGGVSLLRGLADVIRHAARDPNLSAVIAVTVVMNMLGFPYLSMVPVIARDTLGLSPSETGVLMASEGGGAVLGALLLAFSVRPKYYACIFIVGSFVCSVGIQVFVHLHSFAPAVAALFVSGLGLGGFAAMQSTILLTFAAPEMRTRVMGLLVVAIGAGPIGVLALGGLATAIGASTAVALTSGLSIVLLVLSVLRWPTLRKIGREDSQ